jgi:hypothetical protein
VADDDTAEVLAPVQAAEAGAGMNSRLGTELEGVLSDFNAFVSIITTAGGSGGASPAEVASDAHGIMTVVGAIKKTCS